MENELLETVIQSVYDKGYKVGYAKAIENHKFSQVKTPIESTLNRKLWLTPKELREEFNIPLSSQAKMRMKQKIPYHKIGNYVRYKRTDIDIWFDSGKIV